jgi:hypothetical protein
MTPDEIVERLLELKAIYQVIPNTPTLSIFDFFQGRHHSPPKSSDDEDFSKLGYNKDELEESDINANEVKKLELKVITEPALLRKFDSWFLGVNKPETLPAKISGNVMSVQLKEHAFQVHLERVPFGLNAGGINFEYSYILGLEVKNNSLLILTKVGNVVVQIHDITTAQCK